MIRDGDATKQADEMVQMIRQRFRDGHEAIRGQAELRDGSSVKPVNEDGLESSAVWWNSLAGNVHRWDHGKGRR